MRTESLVRYAKSCIHQLEITGKHIECALHYFEEIYKPILEERKVDYIVLHNIPVYATGSVTIFRKVDQVAALNHQRNRLHFAKIEFEKILEGRRKTMKELGLPDDTAAFEAFKSV